MSLVTSPVTGKPYGLQGNRVNGQLGNVGANILHR
jgi:hypothetical protein